jgi:hypothetical protein
LDFNCDGYYDGALSARARGALPFVFTFIRTERKPTFRNTSKARALRDHPAEAK